MKQPFFSIVMPVYNRAGLVATAIESVLVQEFDDWELVIMDDGSTDGSGEVIKRFTDARIKYFYQHNQERSIARNNGIRKANGEFICFLDSDDYYLPQHLKRLYEFISANQFRPALYATGAWVHRGNEKIRLGLYTDKNIHPVRHIFYHKLDMNTACAHHSLFQKHMFDPSIRIGEDTHLWLRLVKDFPFYQVPEYTTVTINHTTSGMVAYYRDADLKLLKEYVRGAKQLFSSVSLSPHISRYEQRLYISKKYRGMAFCCIWARKLRGACSCLTKAVWYTPSYIFTREFFTFHKEFLYMAGRMLLNKPTRKNEG